MTDETAAKYAKSVARAGWLGVWIQAVLAIIPIFMLGYVIFGKVTGTSDGLDLTEYIAMVGLAILAFTTLWSFRYTRLAQRIADPERRPPRPAIARTLWVGVWASCIGIVISLALLFFEIVRLLVLFMMAPQAGVPVIQTQADNRTAWVSAIDAASLLAEVCTLTGELLVLGLSLWLLFKLTRAAGDEHLAG